MSITAMRTSLASPALLLGVTVLVDFLDSAWPGLLVIAIGVAIVQIAWHGRRFLDHRRQEIRKGEWLTAAGMTALRLLAVLWWSICVVAAVALVAAVILWLVYRSGLGG